MNPYLDKLLAIARKDTRRILGLMSGTSLDGLDLALCRVTGYGAQVKLEVEHFTTISYDERFRNQIREVFSKKIVDLERLCLLNAVIGRTHAELILSTLNHWQVEAAQVDLIASHGQTIYHAPQRFHQLSDTPNATLQIGDGDHIAVQTGIITLSDFRQKHVAAGGEGAPLAVYGDFFLFGNADENRILLNIGGIANFTFLPKRGSRFPVVTTDTGPGNTLMDAYCREKLNRAFDDNGKIAATGVVDESLLDCLLQLAFLQQPFPKTTGPELFHLAYLSEAQRKTQTQHLPPEDVLATLAHLTARSIAHAIRACVPSDEPCAVYVSGGGANNFFLTQLLQRYLGDALPLHPVEQLGIPTEAKEAILFALLANEAVAAPEPTLRGGTTLPGIGLGKISLPG